MPEASGLNPGELLDGRYRIEGLLGRGGMGAVYRAHDLARDQPAAIKVLLELDLDLLERFEREAQVAARVDSDGGVVRILGVGRARVPYIAMELVEGEDLEAHLGHGLPAPKLARLLAQVARTLARLHAAGVVHRDLKPANILIDHDGRPRLVDFGIAHDRERERLTRTGDLLGTPGYMAPEQADDAKSVDALSDVYSLGAILYRGLAGRPPFQGDLQQVLHDLLMSDPPPPSRVVPGTPRDLEAVCLKAMAKSRRDRYPSATALAEDLERAVAGKPVTARPLGGWTLFRRRYTRGDPGARLVVRALLGVVVLAVIAGLFAIRLWANRVVDRHATWEQATLAPLQYGYGRAKGAGPSLNDADLRAREEQLAQARPFANAQARLRLADALARLAAHRVLLRHQAGEAVEPPDGVDAPSLIVAAQILADRGRGQAASRKLKRAADAPGAGRLEARVRLLLRLRLVTDRTADPQIRVESLLAEAKKIDGDADLRRLAGERLLSEIPAAYAHVVLRAPELPAPAAKLEALATLVQERGGKPGDLLEPKRRALEESADSWRAALKRLKVSPRRELLPLLKRLSSVLRARPALPPGPGLRAVGDEALAIARAAYNKVRYRAQADRATQELAQLIVDVSQHLYYEIDPTRREPKGLLEPLLLVLHGPLVERVALELPLAMLRLNESRTLTASPRRLLAKVVTGGDQRARLRAVIPLLEDLNQVPSRSRSRATRYAVLAVHMHLDTYKPESHGGDVQKAIVATDDLLRLAAEVCSDRRLLNDLSPVYQARAWLTRARLTLRQHALFGERATGRPTDRDLPRLLKDAIGYCRRAREAKIGIENLQSTFDEEANATRALRGPEAELEVWRGAIALYTEQLQGQADLKFKVRRSSAKAHRRYSERLLSLGRGPEALTAATAAVKLADGAYEMSKDPEVFHARALLARLHSNEKRYDAADEALRPSVPKGLVNTELASQYLRSAIERGNEAEARRRWKLALSVRPRNATDLAGWRERLDRLGGQ